ncbi:hypothetical protein [Oscillatoria sp. FACHB-1406]|uniref:hypothetical protein n=1 Tax=Oscillatoria sp. FACHB-1406 TaxID=2692846 RepID=UPI001688CDB6|nr:hypothetical protein [Oscillatoria sp. FACHB-1406]MBD2576880.1 hypothetical protein [Oscillatoria sp. FACHB-1406]
MNSPEIAALGASLRRIDRKPLATDSKEERTRVWYQGGEPYFDLFVELQNEEVVWFQLTLRGRAISWSKDRNCSPVSQANCWQTGQTNDLQADDLMFYSASKLIEGDRHIDDAFLDLVYAILKTRTGENIFDQILALFEEL